MLSERDKEMITVNSLIGYCLSAEAIMSSNIQKKELQRWAAGLVEIANILAVKLDNTKPPTPAGLKE